MALILQVPDPDCQFIVEVGISSAGVGVSLSQHAVIKQKLHPCAFSSCRLTPAERINDMGNKKLLVVKLVLEEWCYWLEGAKMPFLVWIDHRNLEYIHSARILNSKQACWSLFFHRFNVTLSYGPSSCTAKPNALSCQFPETPYEKSEPSPIIPASCFIASITWEIEGRVWPAIGNKPGRSSFPPDSLFVPAPLTLEIVGVMMNVVSVHASQVGCEMEEK